VIVVSPDLARRQRQEQWAGQREVDLAARAAARAWQRWQRPEGLDPLRKARDFQRLKMAMEHLRQVLETQPEPRPPSRRQLVTRDHRRPR
jgi:hypothetical protein